MNKRIGDMTRDELMDYIIELDEENGIYERQLKKIKKQKDDVVEFLNTTDTFVSNVGKEKILRMLGEIDNE